MELERFSVQDVAQLLTQSGIPPATVEWLEQNEVDGLALLSLVEDLVEFKDVVPQAGLRLKVKRVVANLKVTSQSRGHVVEQEEPLSSDVSCLLSEANRVLYGESSEMIESLNVTATSPLPATSATASPYLPATSPLPGHAIDDDDEQQFTPAKDTASGDKKMTAIRKPLPCPCPLPSNFDVFIKNAIQANAVVGNAKIHLLHQAGEFYFNICPEPTPSEYQIMAVTLCDSYHQLKDRDPTHYWRTVKKQLSQLFRNLRRRSQLPPPKKMKLVEYADVEENQQTDGGSEDSVSYERNCSLLIKEANKKFPRVELVQGLLRHTHSFRRREIEMSAQAASAIMEKHSYFKDTRWMLFELELMVGGEAVTGMAGNWQEIGQKLQPAATDLQIVSLLDKKFRGSGVNSKGFPLLKVFEIGTSFDTVFRERSFPEPRVVGFGADGTEMQQCFVVSESCVLVEIKPPTVFAALQAVLATYYCLHISYPQASIPASCVLLFLQEMVLKKEENTTKKPVRYTSFVNNI